jgi:uncharacterized protein (TIGR02118 family)
MKMIKNITLLKRKPGTSREEFIRYYEEEFAPMTVKLFTTLKGYRRNYVIVPPGSEELPFDCISEFWFEDMKGSKAAVEVLLKTEAGKAVRDAEKSFTDESKRVAFLVEEHISI